MFEIGKEPVLMTILKTCPESLGQGGGKFEGEGVRLR